MDKKWKEMLEQHEYERSLLEAILYFSKDKEKGYFLPTIQEFVLSEVVNGTIAYVGGNAGLVGYRKKSINHRISFENDLCNYFKEEMEGAKGKIDTKVKKAILEMTEIKWMYVPEPGDNYPTCRLYRYYKGFAGGGICNAVFQSTYYLDSHTISKVENEILPKLSNSEKRDVEGVGKAMRKFVNGDIEYIKSHYFW